MPKRCDLTTKLLVLLGEKKVIKVFVVAIYSNFVYLKGYITRSFFLIFSSQRQTIYIIKLSSLGIPKIKKIYLIYFTLL